MRAHIMQGVTVLVLVLMWCTQTVHSQEGIGLTLNNVQYTNNSVVTSTDIGTDSAALFCTSTRSGCCSSADASHWYFPDGSQVQRTGTTYYRTRTFSYIGGGTVRLHRNPGATTTGVFHCDIPDASGELQSIYVGIYNATTGSPSITSLRYDNQSRTLTCTSTGGPATTVSWRRDGTVVTPNATYQQTKRVVDPVVGTYQTVLTIDSSVSQSDIVGIYYCTVENARGRSSMMVVVVAGEGVRLSLSGTTYQNNSLVTLEDIGEDDDALLCVTDLTACCRYPYSVAIGNWFFPNGTRIPSRGTQWDFHRTRGQMVVLLNRRRSGENGIYHCKIPDAMNVYQTIYIGVYTASTGDVVVSSVQFQLTSELNATTPTFTLTCTSTGGPATTVSWTSNNSAVTEDRNNHITSQILTDPETATYTHTLTVTGRLVGEYECNVSNNKPSSSSGVVVVVAADSPTDLTAERLPQEPGSFRVSWTPPASLANLTGYRIYHNGADDSGNVDVGASATEVTIDNRMLGVTYSITMVALSPHLPSPVVGPVSVTLGEGVTPPSPPIHMQPEPTPPSPPIHMQPEPTPPSLTSVQPEPTPPPTTSMQPEPTPPAGSTALFQLRLSGLPSTCRTWVGSDTSAKLSDITNAVVQNTERPCQCGFNAEYITDYAFQCFPDSDQQVTFRARLHETAHANSSQLIEDIQQWVNTGTSIAVQGVRMNIDICPVAIFSFEDPQCPTQSTSQSDFFSTAAVVGGVVAVVLIFAVTVIIIAALMTKNRKYKYSIDQDLRRQPAKWSDVAGSNTLTSQCEAYKLVNLGQEHETAREHEYAVIPARQQTQEGEYDTITTQPDVPTLQ